jgi:hypothetical protein
VVEVKPNIATCFTVFKLVCGLALVLREKGCLLLWPDSWNSGFQLSQSSDIAVKVDPGNPTGLRFSHLKRQCISLYLLMATFWTFALMRNSRVATPWIVVLISTRSSDTTSRHRWWCGLGNCQLQFRSGSASPDRLAFGGL